MFLKVPDSQRIHTGGGTASGNLLKVQPALHTQLAFPLRFSPIEVVPKSQLKQESETGQKQDRGGVR